MEKDKKDTSWMDTNEKTKELYLSEQALGAIMMSLQRAILNQEDITGLLRSFRIKNSEIGLVVLNPPIVKFDEPEDSEGAEEMEEELSMEELD